MAINLNLMSISYAEWVRDGQQWIIKSCWKCAQMRCFWKIFHLIKQWQRQENHRLLATWLYTRSRKALSCRAWNRAKRKPCRLCAVLLSLSGLSCCAGAYLLISSSVSLPIPCSFLFVHISIHSSLSYLINALCSLYLLNRWCSVSHLCAGRPQGLCLSTFQLCTCLSGFIR